MRLASLVHQYLVAFKAKYAAQLLPGQLRAIGAIQRCRTPDSGEMLLACTDRSARTMKPLSGWIGNRPNCCRWNTSW